MTAEEILAIVPDGGGWRMLPNGNRVKLGNGVTLGDLVTLGDGVRLGKWVTFNATPCQVLCHPYTVYPFSNVRIGVGCVVHDVGYWSQIPDELADHPECEPWSNYQAAIELVKQWMKNNPEEGKRTA